VYRAAAYSVELADFNLFSICTETNYTKPYAGFYRVYRAAAYSVELADFNLFSICTETNYSR
jgi:hypothetical protein